MAQRFAQPTDVVQRRYEICRAYFLEGCTAAALADRFGLHVGTVQSIVRDFAANPTLSQFFVRTRPGRKTSPKREAVRERAVELRRQNQTLGQIVGQLRTEGHVMSGSYLAAILRQEGVSGRRGARRPPRPGERASDGAEGPAVADVRERSWEAGRAVPTQVAGLFLFVYFCFNKIYS